MSEERPESIDLAFTLNGEPAGARIEPRELLVDVLREQFGLRGTKRSCDLGACGACTVLVDGLPASSCSTLAADVEGRSVVTIEGLGTAKSLDPVQQQRNEDDLERKRDAGRRVQVRLVRDITDDQRRQHEHRAL